MNNFIKKSVYNKWELGSEMYAAVPNNFPNKTHRSFIQKAFMFFILLACSTTIMATTYTVTNTNNSGAGSLRQAILDANANPGFDIVEFNIPVGLLTNGVAVITVPHSGLYGLGWITDSLLIDGTSQTRNVGNTNPGTYGFNGTVGTGPDGIEGTGDETAIPQLEKPEIQIVGELHSIGTGYHLIFTYGPYLEIRGVCGRGSGNFLLVQNNLDCHVIMRECVIGTETATALSPTSISWRQQLWQPGYAVYMANSTNTGKVKIEIDHNIMGYAGRDFAGLVGFNPSLNPASTYSVTNNEFILDTFCRAAIGTNGNSNGSNGTLTFANNYIRTEGNPGPGGFQGVSFNWDFYTGTGNTSQKNVLNNTIENCYNNTFHGDGKVLFKNNVIKNSSSVGYQVAQGINTTGSDEPTNFVKVSQNSFYDNASIGFDLSGGTPIDANNGLKDIVQNYRMDYPIFTSATLSGNTLTVAGYVGSAASQATFANSTIELFASDDSPNNQGGEAVLGDGLNQQHGEGRVYLGTLTSGATGSFSGSITISAAAMTAWRSFMGVPSAAFNAPVTATATDPQGNTSEFGANITVAIPAAFEICFNGIDDDGDSNTDCADSDCTCFGPVALATPVCNQPPVADDETLTTPKNVSVNIPVLTGDTDPDLPAQTLTVTQINGLNATVNTPVIVPNGTVTLLADGTVTFTPTSGVTGASTFPYTVCDSGSPTLCDQGQVNITILPDQDNDGIPDSIDIDDDNDGVLDSNENPAGYADGGGDLDNDGTPNYQDTQNPNCGGLNTAGTCINYDKDGDGIPDQFDLDSDNDGVTDVVEAGATDPDNNGIIGSGSVPTDTDHDGLADVVDQTPLAGAAGSMGTPNTDTDGDGKPNSEDLDSDNDGITDILEAGGSDPDNNGIAGNTLIPTDTDGDGIADVADQSPIFGDTGNTTPNEDSDGDMKPDAYDLDSDNDGITDIVESGGNDADNNGIVGIGTLPTDTDGDGLADTADQSNGFGDVNNTTPYADFDGDSTPNAEDIDSDNDGLTDVVEAGLPDPDNNGIIDTGIIPQDTDGDGLADVADQSGSFGDAGNATVPTNTDASGSPNYLDIDADNDGIVDNIEWQTFAGYTAPTGMDTDDDGLDNAYDQTNGFGDAMNTNTPTNTDGADTPDYIDLNSDNDTQSDAIEGWDTNGDNVANIVPANADADNDGLDDAYDANDAATNPTNGTTPNSYPNLDASATTERDWRELLPEICGNGIDDDGDGLTDENCPDFTPTIEMESVTFLTGFVSRDFVINISEINNAPSVGQIVLKIPKISAFDYSFSPTATNANVYGGSPVNNSLWNMTQNSLFITLTLKPGVVLPAYNIYSIGMTVTRKANVPSQTNQPITITIVDASGSDNNDFNNTYNVVVKAQ